MSIIIWVGYGHEEPSIARGSTHVFGRAGSFTLNAERIPLTWLDPQTTLEENLVPPGISEVVFVLEMEPFAVLRQNLAQRHDPGIFVVHLDEVLIQEPRVSVESVIDPEMVQVRVGPTRSASSSGIPAWKPSKSVRRLKNPTVDRDRFALDVFPIRPMGVREAIQRALKDG